MPGQLKGMDGSRVSLQVSPSSVDSSTSQSSMRGCQGETVLSGMPTASRPSGNWSKRAWPAWIPSRL